VTAAGSVDAIIVGAGIVGAACARALAREGLRVVVLEAQYVACGATSAAMGHLVVMDDSPEQLALTALSTARWRELARTLHAPVEYDPCGTIWVAEDATQLELVAEKRRTYAEHGITSEMLGSARLTEMEPCLRDGLAGGLLVAGDAVLYPPNAALALLEDARACGASVREGTDVSEILDGAVRCGGEVLEAPIIVLAAGAETVRLVPEMPIIPRKGHLAITDRIPGLCRHQLVELGYLASAHEMTNESVAFNVQPRATGQLLIGSSRELVGWDSSINRDVLRQMLARAVSFVPGLARTSMVRIWTGFRPATPDKLPLIGAWTPVAGLWIAAGHEGLGITTALGTAEILASLIVGRRPPISATAFSPLRILEPASVTVH
jgi:glycine/D-amino acid oxidase-like deaminating enzyme